MSNDRESVVTKVLAVMLLVVAAALVWTVYQVRHQPTQVVGSAEPRPIMQRPDDKLGADEQGTISVFEQFSPAVVHVTNIAVGQDWRTLEPMEIPQGTGSGFIWDEAGHILTNFHVVQGASRARVTLKNGKTFEAKIVGRAPDKDLAVLQIDTSADRLVRIPLGESSKLKVGQKVLAIGNPFGLDQTLTTGVISALGRDIKSVTGHSISDVIQTDASINPGNSGGPLLDSAGRLIGINTAIYSPSGANAGIGFAIPVDTINTIVPQLIKHGKIERPGLGINTFTDQVAARNGIDGVVIKQVAKGGAADQAGLVGVRDTPAGTVLGDVIVGVDSRPIHGHADLFAALDSHKVGDGVEVAVNNQGRVRTVKVTLQAISEP
jgi:S1-C subfamily serine protease